MLFSTENGLLRHNSITSWKKSINNMSLYRGITVDFFNLFTQWRILDWFPAFGHHKYSCYEYSCTDFCINISFSFLKHKYSGVWLQSCKVREYLSLCGTAELFSRMTGPFTHQQYRRAPISLHLCQNSILPVFLILVFMVDVK